MKHFLNGLVLALVIFIFQGCSKSDLIKYLLNNPGKSGCEIVEGEFDLVEYPDEVTGPLFKKYYDSQTKMLNRIDIGYRNIVGSVPVVKPMYISYEAQKMILLDENHDTSIVLHFNSKGQVQKATVPRFLGFLPNQEVRFLYSGNHLKEVQVYDAGWYSYVKVEYDQKKKNVSKLHMGVANITYEYDYTKKAKGQCYIDENLGDAYNFWYLLKFLNLLPSIEPENVLKSTYSVTNSYPGDFLRKYSAHQFDGGKLTYYKSDIWLTNINTGVTSFLYEEEFRMKWKCY